MTSIRLTAPNISCQHCAMAIKRELAGMEDIRVVEVDVPSKAVVLEYRDAQALERALAALDDIGYPAQAEA